MATLKFLYSNRKRFKFWSVDHAKAWAKRILLIGKLLSSNYRWLILKKSGAQLADTAEIGKVKIDGDKTKLRIGACTTIGRVEIALHDEVEIGSYVCINDGVKILTASHDVNDVHWSLKKGSIVIKDYAWIATNVILLPNVVIGKGAVIGAGAVVSKDVPDFGIAIGNPMVILHKNRIQNLDYNPTGLLALNNAWLNG